MRDRRGIGWWLGAGALALATGLGAGEVGAINDGDEDQLIGTLGLAFTY